MQDYDTISITSDDSLYPAAFEVLQRPPAELFAKGNTSLLENHLRVGIVGTRNASQYGKVITDKLVSKIAPHGIPVVSGLAYGIDGFAHRAAVEYGTPAVAVLPGSVDIVYPAGHRGLALDILETGGLLISEYGTVEPPTPYRFIERNRLIASLSDILIVVEAEPGSGSFHTVDAAISAGKTVLAVPGNINSSRSAGTNSLIRDGVRPLVEPSELLALLGINEIIIKPEKFAQNVHERKILKCLEDGPVSSGELLQKTALEPSIYNVCLSMLEIRGVISISNGRVQYIS